MPERYFCYVHTGETSPVVYQLMNCGIKPSGDKIDQIQVLSENGYSNKGSSELVKRSCRVISTLLHN